MKTLVIVDFASPNGSLYGAEKAQKNVIELIKTDKHLGTTH